MGNRENISLINDRLKQTLTIIRDIKRNQVVGGETRIERNLDEELRRNRLVTNEPEKI